ncbi:YwqI/YxiC family protein [Caldibacillus lycopersici]|uniref:YwqI/YxiC family protein n=1 Tax=Perspicuibacillus lycopersici TaxID=1325689 RepID=A0AAE3IZ93_9BACI|nr:YwqI/YxiC family protein [Perspicuibacillus lycopersici]MCU9614790.1 YwqI/YxiC family protein [Perspicuibacillus lycopersici]
MEQIKLDYFTVKKHLDLMNEQVNRISFTMPFEGDIGRNKLEFTDKWMDREAKFYSLLVQYKEILKKNLEDTYVSIELLKSQDEIARMNHKQTELKNL